MIELIDSAPASAEMATRDPDILALKDEARRGITDGDVIGALVTLLGTVDYVGNSSMDITVEVYSEKVSTGERRHTHTAHIVFVAIDQNGKPTRVPRLVAETPEEQARYEAARKHREGFRRP